MMLNLVLTLILICHFPFEHIFMDTGDIFYLLLKCTTNYMIAFNESVFKSKTLCLGCQRLSKIRPIVYLLHRYSTDESYSTPEAIARIAVNLF